MISMVASSRAARCACASPRIASRVAVVVVVGSAAVAVVAVGTAAVAVVVVAASAEGTVAAVVAASELDLAPIATAIGEAWAGELVHGFRTGKRQIIGPWPGTIGEARMRVLANLRRKLAIPTLDGLARVTTAAARRTWEHHSRPDPEP